MQNKLEFADGVTWNYQWTEYSTNVGATHTASITWPADTAMFVYTASSIDISGKNSIAFFNITKNNTALTTPVMSNKYWFLSSDGNLSGDIDIELSLSNPCGYGGETIIAESSTSWKVVYANDWNTKCPYSTLGISSQFVTSTNKSAYPNNNYQNGHWYELYSTPDNINVTDDYLIGGVDYTYNINTDDNIRIGQSACAKIEFYTQMLDKSFQGRTCTYYIKQDNDNNFRKIGVFYIAKAERINSYGKYKMTGYDNSYRLNTIIDDWLYHTSYDANKYRSWDTGLSTSSLTTTYISGYDGTGYALTLCTDIEFEYNSAATSAATMWRFKIGSGTSFITLPATSPSASVKQEIQDWVDAAKGKCICAMSRYTGSPSVGSYVNLKTFNYYNGTATIDWNSGYPHITLTQSKESWAPYNAISSNTYFTEVDESIVTYNEAGQTDYPADGIQIDGTEYLMYHRLYHRDPIVTNGRSTPTLIISSICGELGLNYSFSSSMGPSYIYFGFTASGITATAMLSYLAEVCGGYLAADVDGNITIKTLGSISSSSATLNNTKYKSYTYQDEAVNLIIPRVIIKQDESDSNGVASTDGSDSKSYYITKNPWTLNTTEANIQAIANFVYNKFKAIYGNVSTNTYTPMKIDCLQDWKIVPGQVVTVNGVKTYIFSKRMNASGVSFESTGDNNEEIMTVAQIESANNLNGKDIILTSYDYNNNASASLTIKGNDGSIYITTSGTGHVYVNGNILV